MKRRILSLLTLIFLLAALAIPGAAEEMPKLRHVQDLAGLLTDQQALSLEAEAARLLEIYDMDIVLLTTNTLGGKTPQDYADDYYDDNGYGCGEDLSGALFLLSMEDRDWYISTCGEAIYALTDFGIQYSSAHAIDYFSRGEYYSGFYSWLAALPEYFDAYEAGSPIDGWADYSDDYYHGDQEAVIYYDGPVSPSFLGALIIGLIAGGVTLFVLRSGMNTKRSQPSAGSYTTNFQLDQQRDLFLYSNVTKRPRPRESSSSGRSGGGSSVHRSSGGGRHGGGGGKF